MSPTVRVPRLERLPLVAERLGLSERTVVRMVKAGTFPAPMKIGVRTVAWDGHAIDAWLTDKAQAAAAVMRAMTVVVG